MKVYINYLWITLFCLITNLSFSQDLIERTRSGEQLSNRNSTQNKIATLIENSRGLGEFQPTKFLQVDTKVNKNNSYNDITRDAVFLTLEKQSLQDFFSQRNSNILFNIPVFEDKVVTLELTQVHIYNPEYQLKTSDGISQKDSKKRFYRGIIKDNPNSTAALSIFEEEIRLVISDDAGNYVLGRLDTSDTSYVFYNDKKLKITRDFSCGVLEHELPTANSKSILPPLEKNSTTNCVQIYIEADYQMYQDFSSNVTNTENHILGLFNEVATLYANESIDIMISELFIWTSVDPYASLTATDEILELFGQTLQNNYTGDLAHLVTTRNLGGGIAWLDVLCSDYHTFQADWDNDGILETHHAGPYAFSSNMNTYNNFPTYSWAVEVFAHEMGHNLGSRHTHACVWGPNNDTQIDDCGNVYAFNNSVIPEGNLCFNNSTPILPSFGTIMSYCHLQTNINFNNGFGVEPGDLLRNNIAAALAINCITGGCNSTLPSCTDGIQNGDETGIDCGGTMCPPCSNCVDTATTSLTYNTSGCSNYFADLTVSDLVIDANTQPSIMLYDSINAQAAIYIANTNVDLNNLGPIDVLTLDSNPNFSTWPLSQNITIQCNHEYQIFLMYNFCGQQKSLEQSFTIPCPNPSVDLGPDQVILTGEVLTVTPIINSPIGFSCVWTPGNTLSNGECDLVFSHSQSGVYTYILTLTDNQGCTVSDEITITVIEEISPFQQSCGEVGDEVLTDIIGTLDGGYAGVGNIQNNGSNKQDIIVVKWDKDFSIEWSKKYGNLEDDKGKSIIQTNDGGYFIVGNTKSVVTTREDILAIKIDASGNVQWSNSFEGSDDNHTYHGAIGKGIQTTDGGYMIGGFETNSPESNGYQDFYVIKIDAAGQLQWSNTYGGTDNDWITSIIPLSDGNYLLAGSTSSFSTTQHDYLLVKIDISGNTLWVKKIGTSSNEGLVDVLENAAGELLVLGKINTSSFANTLINIAKLTTTGDLIWAKEYNGIGLEFPRRIHIAPNTGYTISGSTNSFTSDSNIDGFLMNVDENGTINWTRTYGTSMNDNIYGSILAFDNGYFMLGNTQDTDTDLYIVKTDQQGMLGDSCFQTVNLIENTLSMTVWNNITVNVSSINNSNYFYMLTNDIPLSCQGLCTPNQIVPCGVCDASNGNLITNGDFELGDTGFTTALTENSPCTSGTFGTYTVGHSFADLCFDTITFDNTISDNTGHFMVIDGHEDHPIDIWSSNVSVVKDSTYNFSFWVYVPMDNGQNIPGFQVSLGSLELMSVLSTGIATDQWVQFSTSWTAPGNGQLPITIMQTNNGGQGYDYGIDDICFSLTSSPISLELEFESPIMCSNDTLDINALVSGATGITTCSWDAPYVGFLSIGCTATFIPNESGTFDIGVTVTDENGCEATQFVAVEVLNCSVAPCGVCDASIGNLITNGDFELGDTGFTTVLTENSPCTSGTFGTYTIGHSFADLCFNTISFDHTIGDNTGHFMVIDGEENNSANIYSNTVVVQKDSTYNFSFWLYVPSANNQYIPEFQISIGSVPIMNIFDAQIITDQWTEYSTSWTAIGGHILPIVIHQTNNGGAGFDYGIDDICFSLSSSPISVELTCESPIICSNDTLNLNAIVTGATGVSTCSWDAPYTGFSSTDCTATFIPNGPGTFDIGVTVTDENGCEATQFITVEVLNCPFEPCFQEDANCSTTFVDDISGIFNVPQSCMWVDGWTVIGVAPFYGNITLTPHQVDIFPGDQVSMSIDWDCTAFEGCVKQRISIKPTLAVPSPTCPNTFPVILEYCVCGGTLLSNSCEDAIIVTEVPIDTSTFAAENTVTSNALLPNNTDVTFSAGKSITLNPGFEVEAGSEFTAVIGDCPENGVLQNNNSTQPIVKLLPATKDKIRIQYELVEASTVQIFLLNTQGQLIEDLSIPELQQKGVHSFDYDKADLPSGVYILKFRAGSVQLSEKIVIN